MRSDFAHHFSDFAITLTREQILLHLEENKIEHVKTFEDAKEGYRKASIFALEARLGEVKAGKLRHLKFNLKLPICYVEQYDELLQMFTMAKEDEHELELAMYRCIVDDSWSWTDSFNVTNSAYTVS